MTGKLVDIPAINTNTLTNEYCQKMHSSNARCICTECYSFAMLEGSRKNCAPAWEKNSILLKSNILKELPQFNSLYVRFHGHGELINETHFINFLLIAQYNQKTTFSLYTKRHKLVKKVLQGIDWYGSTHASGQDVFIRKIPKNLILVYSNPLKDRVTDKKPQYFHKVFNTVTQENAQDNCTGRKCIECLACYQFDGSSVLVERVKKRA